MAASQRVPLLEALAIRLGVLFSMESTSGRLLWLIFICILPTFTCLFTYCLHFSQLAPTRHLNIAHQQVK